MPRLRRLPLDPKKSAVLAGLTYVAAGKPGFARRRSGTGFVYLDLDGRIIRKKDVLDRIRALVLPPAWENVWICPSPDGHLQATGVDARGRRQYRYHADYRQFRNHTKFHKMLDFAKALPGIRAQVNHDLARTSLGREKVLATIVRLLETTFIRVGNEEYAKENSSFGLTTLRDRHVKIEGSTIRFQFRGKSRQMHDIELEDKRLARIVKQCRDLPGYELFQYRDEFGEIHSVDSSDVNGYLHEITGESFTAKDFRTWAGTMQAALHLAELGEFTSESQAKRNIVEAVKATAAKLGNRPATCRKYYVHPVILDSYADGTLFQYVRPPEPDSEEGLTPAGQISTQPEASLFPEEECVVRLIKKHSAALLEAALPLRAA